MMEKCAVLVFGPWWAMDRRPYPGVKEGTMDRRYTPRYLRPVAADSNREAGERIGA
jgi:hypothetical protein